jgi:thermostable 8-oxoguanine DNA glycosylase
MQEMFALIGDTIERLEISDPSDFVLPGVRWGAFDELLTPAFWRGQAWQHERLGTYRPVGPGKTLSEEMAACLLGGFGMKAELGLAAVARLRDRGLLRGEPAEDVLESALAEPVTIRGYPRRYRFPRQKAHYLARCFTWLSDFAEPNDDIALRDCLAQFPGIGLKTASWIVRNYRRSNDVAIIDVHILRAGRHIGLFRPDLAPQRDYCVLEETFIRFAGALNTGAGMLDRLMWDYMRRLAMTGILTENCVPNRVVFVEKAPRRRGQAMPSGGISQRASD